MTEQTLTAEVTGSVWKVVARPGDTLEPEGVLMILESMKMEIPVLAMDGGRVVRILVSEKESVTEGQDLAVISRP